MSSIDPSSSDSSDNSAGNSSEQLERAIAEYLDLIDQGAVFDVEAWLASHQSIRSQLQEFLETEREFDSAFPPRNAPSVGSLDETCEMPGGATGSATPMTSASGRNKLFRGKDRIGPYQFSRLLGAGGMGQVFEAVDPNGNLVAVKVLSQQWSRSPESLQRFKMEGKIASAINHPRCVFVRAADEDQGVPYIVMELMTGKTLKDLSQESGKLPVDKAIRAIMDVLDGLEEAHSHGMIHRDIKPGNCYLESNGRVKLGDFGLARSIEDSSELTRTGDFVGTPLFASPEQVKGQPIDARTDIYSVCATLYFLLAGQAPFAGSSPTNVIARIVSEDPIPLRKLNPEVPVLLERIVMRGLSRDRKLRFQTVTELKQALEPFVRGRHSIAAWGRRFAAFCIDGAFTAILGGVTAQFVKTEDSNGVLPLVSYLCLMAPFLVYYLLFEGVGYASIGKILLRLQIADRVTGERPHRLKVVVRTLVALILMGIGTDLLTYLSADPSDTFGWVFRQWTGYIISYTLILVPVLFTKPYRLLMHDWLTGTMVVDRPRKSAQQQLAQSASEFQTPLLSATSYPEKIGEFSVKGLILSGSRHTVLSCRDESLNRNIWVWMRDSGEPELPIARRECDRSTRLRWLSNGRFKDRQWDAFLAPTGAPLKHWMTPESPLGWKETRGILRQLAIEIEESQWEDLPNQIETLDQVWLDSRGRLTTIDWPVSDQLDGTSHSSQLEQSRGVLCEAARQCLTGTSLPLDSERRPIKALVPVHVRALLSELSAAAATETSSGSKETPPFSVGSFLQKLDSHANKPTEPTYESRLLGLGVAITPALLLLGMVMVVSRMGSVLVLDKITDLMVAPVVAKAMLDEGEDNGLWSSSDSASGLTKQELEQWLAGQPDRIVALKDLYSQRYPQLSGFARVLAKETKLVEDPISQLDKVVIEWKDERCVAVNWKSDGDRTEFELAAIARLVQAPTDAKPQELLRRGPIILTIVTLAPFLLWIGWAGVTGGGLSMWISGLQVVRADGTPANWLIRLIRPLLAGIPFLVLQAFITWNDLNNPDLLWLSSLAHQVLLWLFLIYAILVVAFPRRAPHDWLLGTHLVAK